MVSSDGTVHTLDDPEIVLNFAMLSTEVLVRNGAAASNATRSLLAVAKSGGLQDVTASVTLDLISVSFTNPETGHPVTRLHAVEGPHFNVAALAVAERTVEDVITGRVDFIGGLDALHAAEQPTRRTHPLRVITGWFCVGFGFAWLMGGDLKVCLVSALTTAIIEAIGQPLSKSSLPGFYSHILAGMLAVSAGAVATQTVDVSQPALIVVASLVARLAGVASLSAAHDLLTGWYLTATARIMGAITDTAGLVIGVILGIVSMDHVGIALRLDATPQQTSDVVQGVLAAGLVSLGFALACAARPIHLATLACLGASAALCQMGLDLLGVSTITSVAGAAASVAVLSVIAARPMDLPTLAALTVAMVPLLPGSLIYRGFLDLATGKHTASGEFFQATATALAIGTGAVLGQYLVWRTLWHLKHAQLARQRRVMGQDRIDEAQLAAQALATPDFRRPFVSEESPKDASS